jgi:hypothetical protein
MTPKQKAKILNTPAYLRVLNEKQKQLVGLPKGKYGDGDVLINDSGELYYIVFPPSSFLG